MKKSELKVDMTEPLIEIGNAKISTKGFVPKYPNYCKTKKEDLDKKYGRLTILGIAGKFEEARTNGIICNRLAVLTKCDCGNESVQSLHNLKNGKIQSCGCLFLETTINKGKANKTHGLYIDYKERLRVNKIIQEDFLKQFKASDLNIKIQKVLYNKFRDYKDSSKKHARKTWNLTPEQFTEIVIQPCHYCGSKETINGIDRIDSEIGYEKENTLPCCTKCNMMKGKLSYSEFIQQCINIALIKNN